MKEMTYDELRVVQLDILQYIHDFCLKNDIKYSLAYGTLLGAVRHGGYIPWDDDIDIAMPRWDYEKFLKLFHDENGVYQVYECRKDKDYKIAFGKVCDNRTLINERANTKKIGIFVDVFPIDNLGDTYEESLSMFNSYKDIRMVVQVKGRLIGDVKKWWKKILMALLKIKYLFYDVNDHLCKANNTLAKYENPNSKYVGLVVDGKSNEIIERKAWSSFAPISFEGLSFMAVKDTDAYLKHAYGDYMKLPPKEQQIPKHDFEAIYWKD